MRSVLIPVLVLSFAGACKKVAEPPPTQGRAEVVPPEPEKTRDYDPVPDELLADDVVAYALAVWSDEAHTFDEEAAFQIALKVVGDEMSITDETASKAGTLGLFLKLQAFDDFELPEQNVRIFGHDLTAQDKKKLLGARSALYVIVNTTAERAMADYQRASRVVAALAKKTGAVAVDEETREYFGTSAWNERIDNAVASPQFNINWHTVVHSYRKPELARVISLGMAKFGLPDIVVNDVPPGWSSSMASLVNLVAQTLIENGGQVRGSRLDVSLESLKNRDFAEAFELDEGGTGKATLSLGIAVAEEGDPDNRLVEVVFPGPKGELHTRQRALLDELWGASPDQVIDAEARNVALAAASEKARAELIKDVKPEFGGESVMRLIVKAPFATADGGAEHMWVDVTRWEDTTIVGVLTNQPVYIEGLDKGAKVRVQEGHVSDYVVWLPGGETRGDYTSSILQNQ